MSAPFSGETAKARCGLGLGPPCCSYLLLGKDGFECAKRTSLEAHLTARRHAGTIVAMGDRCSGPPFFTPTKAKGGAL